MYNDTCSPYNGVCTKFLQPKSDSNKISDSNEISTLTLTSVSENDVKEFLSTLESFAIQGLIRNSCYSRIQPFLCLYVYPLCNDSEANFITEQNCTIVRDIVCDVEWSLAITLGLSSLLPVCENLQLESDMTLDEPSNIDNDTGNSLMIKCHEQFSSFCGVCLPLCGEFVMFSDTASDKVDVVLIISAVLAISGGILVCIFAVIRRKTL